MKADRFHVWWQNHILKAEFIGSHVITLHIIYIYIVKSTFYCIIFHWRINSGCSVQQCCQIGQFSAHLGHFWSHWVVKSVGLADEIWAAFINIQQDLENIVKTILPTNPSYCHYHWHWLLTKVSILKCEIELSRYQLQSASDDITYVFLLRFHSIWMSRTFINEQSNLLFWKPPWREETVAPNWQHSVQ